MHGGSHAGPEPERDSHRKRNVACIYGCSPSDDVEKAAELMRGRRVRGVPVLDAEGHVLGVLSLGDFARALSSRATNGVTTPIVARTLFDISRPTA